MFFLSIFFTVFTNYTGRCSRWFTSPVLIFFMFIFIAAPNLLMILMLNDRCQDMRIQSHLLWGRIRTLWYRLREDKRYLGCVALEAEASEYTAPKAEMDGGQKGLKACTGRRNICIMDAGGRGPHNLG